MSSLSDFIADYFGNGPGGPKYATGLEIPEDGRLPQDAEPNYATGLELPEDVLPPQDAEPKYATGLEMPEDGRLPQDAEPRYATGLEIPEEEEPEDADAAPRAKGPLGLGASVGRGGRNDPDDVLAVQKALNRRLKA